MKLLDEIEEMNVLDILERHLEDKINLYVMYSGEADRIGASTDYYEGRLDELMSLKAIISGMKEDIANAKAIKQNRL